jgi:hypothetical protein
VRKPLLQGRLLRVDLRGHAIRYILVGKLGPLLFDGDNADSSSGCPTKQNTRALGHHSSIPFPDPKCTCISRLEKSTDEEKCTGRTMADRKTQHINNKSSGAAAGAATAVHVLFLLGPCRRRHGNWEEGNDCDASPSSSQSRAPRFQ